MKALRWSALVFWLGLGWAARAQNPFAGGSETSSQRLVLSGIAIRAYEQNQKDWPEERLLPIAIAYHLAKEPGKARDLFQQVLAKKPEDDLALLGYGITLVDLARYEDAVPVLAKAWKRTHDVVALEKLARCYSRLAKSAELNAIIPDLINFKYDDLDQVLGILCNYALFESDGARARHTVIEAISGISDEYLASSADLAQAVLIVIKHLDMPERAAAIEKAIRTRAENE